MRHQRTERPALTSASCFRLLGVACALCGTPLRDHAGTIYIGLVPVSYDQPQPTEMPDPPPIIQSSPLPSGSGARALGIAGAFTAVADDATAASWNPAGLTQLERPEVSIVYRFSHERDSRNSRDSNYLVGDDDIDANNINYLSAVIPLRLMDRNVVFSLNYQEAFDFSQKFHASQNSAKSSTSDPTLVNDDDFVDVPFDHSTIYDTGTLHQWEITPTSLKIKRTNCLQTEELTYNSQADIDFEQEGSVQAITPAVGFDITPKLSFGGALNVYQEGLMNTPNIRSKTRATYNGTLYRKITTTSGTIDYEETAHWIIYGSDSGDASYSDQKTIDPENPDIDEMTYHYKGNYVIDEKITRFRGVNATLGSLLTVSEPLTLGFCLDLPWKARARQTKTVRSTVELTDSYGNTHGPYPETTRTSKDIEFTYPLYWALGGVWRWNNRLSTSLDVSQTWWSDYSYKIEGESRKNPLDGSEYSEHRLDDCWALRTGTEYLWVLKRTEIPLRAGFSWEQRPAIGTPDQYWGLTLGTGFSFGKGPNKVIIDIAYMFTWASDVMGSLIPDGQNQVGSDVQRHDVYVSCIYHF